ncbi:MAG TPA: hypothetical protein VL287_16335 [Gemmatimonadales bacterium]|jgi:hypothetical protein|nr:hypothetical protein [Gemmatimonadales bacterium]
MRRALVGHRAAPTEVGAMLEDEERLPWETDGDLPWASEDPEWEAPDPEAWRGTVHLQEWPEDLAGPEYWLYKKQGEEEQ